MNRRQRKPDSATPTGEPATAERSPGQDPCGKDSLCPRQGAGSKGWQSRAETKRERKPMPGLGRRGGWGQKGWKCGREKQGDPAGQTAFGDEGREVPAVAKEPPAGSQNVRSSDEAG